MDGDKFWRRFLLERVPDDQLDGALADIDSRRLGASVGGMHPPPPDWVGVVTVEGALGIRGRILAPGALRWWSSGSIPLLLASSGQPTGGVTRIVRQGPVVIASGYLEDECKGGLPTTGLVPVLGEVAMETAGQVMRVSNAVLKAVSLGVESEWPAAHLVMLEAETGQ